MRLIVFGFLGILLLLNGCGEKAASFNETDLVVLTSDSVPPTFTDKAEKINQLSTLFIREMFKRMRIAPPVKKLPWADAYQQTLKEDKTVMYAVLQTGARRKLFKWVGPLITEGGTEFFIIFNKNTPGDVVAQWSQALNDMKKDGTYRRIITEYNARK